MGFIYKITSPSKKMYVGQTKKKVPQERWKEHCKPSSKKCVALKRAIDKYGAENMTFEEVEECADELLNDREQHWIRELDTLAPKGYNLRSGGGVGETVSEETKEKISSTGRKRSIDKKGYIGSIYKHPSSPSFYLFGTRSQFLGCYPSYKDVEAAAVEYTRDPENFVPKRATWRRKNGTGSVHRHTNSSGRLRWRARMEQDGEIKHLGFYDTKEEAENACDRYLEDPGGFVMPQDCRKIATGSIRFSSGKWQATYIRKYIGRFDTEAQAEAAILAHKEKILRAEGKKPLKE